MKRESATLSPIADIVAEIRAGNIVVLVDDEDRENEGDLVFATDFVTPEKINFLARHGRGLICMSLTEAHAARLGLKPMVSENRSRHGTNFTTSIEAAEGIDTGISAHDRALTVRVAAAPNATAADILQPGHIFPIIARDGGVLVRAGHTEACCDLTRLAGLTPAAVLCEIMREDGTMARVPDLIEFCKTHAMKMLTVAEVIRYRMQHERYVHRVGEALVNTRYGEFRIIAYASEVEGGDSHLALVRGEIDDGNEPVLVRMHAHCLVGDVFGSAGCDCRATLEGAMEIIAAEGRGALIYLHQSARGFSVERVGEQTAISFHKDRTQPSLPESERKTQREIGLGAQILSDLGLRRIRLLTNHPRRVAALEGFDIEIVEQVPVALQNTK
jgi:3,4-dihydroxy 2-butanone 4-phosphate synthase/GTP cyclohydrolase II